jgi:septum formation protein
MNPVRALTLVSISPRRRELLERYVSELRVFAPLAVEAPVRNAGDLVANARRKLESASLAASELGVSADTAVFLDGRAMGKPATKPKAIEMLESLSGRWHDVVTGMALFCEGRIDTASETTRVRFRKLDRETIRAYVATGEPLDKAGGYGIQGLGGLLVERIEGDYFNVVGLPLAALDGLLMAHGLTLLGAEKDI